jgi:foldase protein PrsA
VADATRPIRYDPALVSRWMRTAVACCAAIATAVGVGACGSGVPANSIAVVGNAKVTGAEFAHWTTVLNNAPYVGSGDTPPAVPVPPDYSACIASERKRNPGGSASTWKSTCVTTYNELNQEVTTALIEAIWFQGEANDRHVKVTKAQINAAWNEERKSQKEFSTPKKLDTFLAESGYTIADLKWVLMFNLIEEAIVKKVESKAADVSAAQIAAYYKSHISEYKEPDRRDVDLVLVGTAAKAAAVKSLLAAGKSFASIAKQYSIDPTTRDSGGVEDGVEPGEETAVFNTAIFAAKIGVLESTAKTPFGYYVFKVASDTPASLEPLSTVRTAIKSTLTTNGQTAAIDKLRSTFAKKWRARTTCASGHLVSAMCSNAPLPLSTGSSGTTGSSRSTGSS